MVLRRALLTTGALAILDLDLGVASAAFGVSADLGGSTGLRGSAGLRGSSTSTSASKNACAR